MNNGGLFLRRCFFSIRTIAASGLSRGPSWKTALSCEWAEVRCQGQEWQQTNVCSPVNITPTEMWEEKRIWRGPCRYATRLLGRPFVCSTDDQVVLYCISFGHEAAEKNKQCTVHLLHLIDSIIALTLALQCYPCLAVAVYKKRGKNIFLLWPAFAKAMYLPLSKNISINTWKCE